ncbi:Polyisoprenoid-binding protein YceI [Mucilaginibacter mallensis]|uniref:Polyisoprenoid-binding protein YceI n=1 Tax=Mucilaginibacter mallensis TaxID=652787 RepID=A0A1H2B9V2_MUCMA|nr:YceI family protein [Mucilaginibacter mallensis]SDT54822.1 Polyisoprenoid-binding protein YceI [Mucilaginibacter mallensis]
MNKKYIAIILFFLTNCAFAQVKHTVTKSSITFKIRNMGINTDGNIGGLQASIQFDPANLNSSIIEATADVNTINSDNDLRDEHLKGDSFFDVAKYPKITVKSVSIKQKSGDNYIGQFNITIKARTKSVDVPFTYTVAGANASFKGTMKLKRSDFDLGGGSMVLSDDITIAIDVETSK